VFVTYLPSAPESGLRAVSQSELLARSQCQQKSGGSLWCGLCHSPHAAESDRAQAVRAACLSCHAGLFSAQRHQPASECVSCHMPRLRPTNVAHSAVTDHSIPRLPRSQPQESKRADPELKAWRDADASLSRRDLGLAYFDLAANTHSGSALRQAYQILSQLPPDLRRDPPVEAALASMLLQQDQLSLATQLFARAAAQEPSNARYAYCFGAALSRSGKLSEAIKELQRAIDLDPSQPDPYLELSQLYTKAGQPSLSRRAIERYLVFMPQNISLRLPPGESSLTSGRIR
jgi:tetratricopeptide (TPR) repeat protein